MRRRNSSLILWILFIGLCIVAFILWTQRVEKVPEKKKTNVEIPVDPSLGGTDKKDSEKDKDTVFIQDDQPLEWPTCDPSGVIRHRGYDLWYDESAEQAAWVAYQLTETETIKRYSRTDHFIEDPLIRTRSAGDRDYKGSGYDRGHLAPAADMGWSQQTMEESFYYSNMSPQAPAFNRGIWKRLEEQVRNWAVALDTIYVVTGPVLKGKMSYIGPEKVAVPNYYYKAILKVNGKESKAIGFIMANQSGTGSLDRYTVSIDSLENFTGLDFFGSLNNAVESKIESTLCTACWDWGKSQNSSRSSTDRKYSGENSSVQCSGTTKAGKRCKRMTRDSSGKCYQHQ
ncbi:MAG: hypothetical protein RIT43_2481 [Bacteroidota bacterium]